MTQVNLNELTADQSAFPVFDLKQEQEQIVAQRASQKKIDDTPFRDFYDAGVDNNHAFPNVYTALVLQGKAANIDPDFEYPAEMVEADWEERGLPLEWMQEMTDVL